MGRRLRDPTLGLLGIAIGSAVLIALLLVTTGLGLYLSWLIGASLITVVLFGIDKKRAVGGGSRIPEMLLMLMILVGGFLGGWAGRSVFRHKSNRPEYAIILVVAGVVHALLALWAVAR